MAEKPRIISAPPKITSHSGPKAAMPASATVSEAGTLQKAMSKVLREGRLTRPGFSGAWVNLEFPRNAEEIHRYTVEGARVRLFKSNESGDLVYHLVPEEYMLPKYQTRMLVEVQRELAGNLPDGAHLLKPANLREAMTASAIDVLARRAASAVPGVSKDQEAVTARKLAHILVTYSVGLGVLEPLLRDPNVQDVYVDAPAEENPVHVTLGKLPVEAGSGKCATNITLSEEEAQGLLARFRMQSGRPFSEAMPVLETDLEELSTRVTVIGKPLSPSGVAMALRRHATDPWTLPKFVQNRNVSQLAAGLLWFLIDGRSTMLVAGSRGAGKTSLLGAMMLELPREQRILTIEDTLELPCPEMQRLGYKVQSLYVRSAIGGTSELGADDALRVSLRLGESAIVLGEVRGQETRTLYEAMRSGSAGSAVLGTIHGNSPRSVFERIVYDLGIPAKAFNATDIVVISGLIRPGGGKGYVRRVTSIAEVAKEGGKEGEFNELLAYDPQSDGLAPTDIYMNRSERIRAIAEQWGMSYKEALGNIQARGEIKAALCTAAQRTGRKDFLSASWNARANARYWELVEGMKGADNAALVGSWRAWFDRLAA
ncbi:MAG: type II/IV secretion system ATPase subunit [Euryarchaeota archaeon]|nr:type II/IV secretion system ATPase subunit [Euryarchaeota archaeon]